MKITYKILICDDNKHFIERLREGLSDVNAKSENFHMDVDVATTPNACIDRIQDNVYDIIILDVCIKAENEIVQTNSELIRNSLGSKIYGPELYKHIVKLNSTARVFVVSNLKINDLRVIFNDADVEYFSKGDFSITQIVKCIKNYFDTNKKRIYNNVFIVYGHNTEMRKSVGNYIKSRGLNSIDLLKQSSGGLQFIFDALNECVNTAECAVVLLSSEDICLDKENLQMTFRARQNVIFEMGLFAGNLGKNKVIVLYEKNDKFEFPSDINGIFYIEYDNLGEWKTALSDNLKKIGFVI